MSASKTTKERTKVHVFESNKTKRAHSAERTQAKKGNPNRGLGEHVEKDNIQRRQIRRDQALPSESVPRSPLSNLCAQLTIFALVNPKCCAHTGPGADRPKQLIPTQPSTNSSHACVVDISTLSLGTERGSNFSLYFGGWARKSSHEGMDTTLVLKGFKAYIASMASPTSEPVATRISSGVSHSDTA